jgi:hypothetical protein
VIQHGRRRDVKIDLFKTRLKGWGASVPVRKSPEGLTIVGIRAREGIPFGSLLGVYSGELITDTESERRGLLYAEINRT